MKNVLLVVNGLSYTFPQAYISNENYTLGTETQYPTIPGLEPLVVPTLRTVQVDLTIPMGEIVNKVKYTTMKQMLRTTQYLLFKQGSLNQADTNTQAVSAGAKIPYTDLVLPGVLKVMCAYFGVGCELVCCLLTGFSVSAAPMQSSDEMWSLELAEYDICNLRSTAQNTRQQAELTDGKKFLDA